MSALLLGCRSNGQDAGNTSKARPHGLAGVLGAGAEAEQEAARARMLKAFPYPYVTVAGDRALAEWERLRHAGSGWPVIVGDDGELEALAEQFSLDDPAVFPGTRGKGPSDPAAILKAAGQVRLPQDLQHWLDMPGSNQAELEEPETGPWPKPAEIDRPGLTIASEVLTGKPFARCHILSLPAADGAEVPAYLRWGGWNACPNPELQVAVLRDWKQRYGAELVGINSDTINLRVRRRPATRKEALALALEQYSYCSDIVDQGVGTISALAASLMESDWWYFWWD